MSPSNSSTALGPLSWASQGWVSHGGAPFPLGAGPRPSHLRTLPSALPCAWTHPLRPTNVLCLPSRPSLPVAWGFPLTTCDTHSTWPPQFCNWKQPSFVDSEANSCFQNLTVSYMRAGPYLFWLISITQLLMNEQVPSFPRWSHHLVGVSEEGDRWLRVCCHLPSVLGAPQASALLAGLWPHCSAFISPANVRASIGERGAGPCGRGWVAADAGFLWGYPWGRVVLSWGSGAEKWTWGLCGWGLAAGGW
uniref:Uncharacterized protein n=1 Tax=Myotis myotis TaxID=51298 RepID=A0A7J7UCY4_MYOMY|nr:hypothetical protein mMyoMyo1_008779 [Myotis myotis]